ncbi:MAG: MFS transporter [Acidimicrobiia bacterium]
MVRQSLFTRWFAIVFAAALATELSNSLLVHFPGFLLDLGADEARIGIIVALAGVASIGARPWMGRVMDRRSRRLIIRWGTLLTATGTFAYAFVDEIGALVIVARLVQGLGQAMTATAFWTYISDRFPTEKRTQGIALFGISGLLPLAVGPGLGDLLLGAAGYRGLFFIASGLALLALLLTLFLERTGVHSGATATGFWALLRSGHMTPIWLGTFALSLGFTAAFVFVKTYVTTSGLGSVGPFFLAYGSTAILWRLVFSWVPDRVGPARMITPALLLYALGMTILGVGGSQTILALAGLVTGLGHGIGYPVMLTLSTIRTNRVDRGAATAIFTAIFDLGLIGMAPVLGLTISWFGYRAMFWSTAVTIVIGLAMVRELDLKAGSRISPKLS